MQWSHVGSDFTIGNDMIAITPFAEKRTLRLLLFACLFVFMASLPVGFSFAQDDETPQERHRADGKKCDNSFERSKEDRCECEHSQTCDPGDPADKEKHSHMTSKCQWYCREDMCACANECNS
jgi:hypothetical protein